MRSVQAARLLFAALLLPCAGYATSYYLVTTDQATADTQMDVNHDRTWSFAPVWDWQLGGGVFTIKRSPDTAIDAILTLYAGDTESKLTSVAVAPIVVSTSYAPVSFIFESPVTLMAGYNYSLVLTSATPDTGSQYFIKGQDNNFVDYAFRDEGGGVLPETDPSLPDPGATVPESGTNLFIACGVGAICFLWKRRIE